MKINITYNSKTFSTAKQIFRFKSEMVTFKEVDGKPVIVLH